MSASSVVNVAYILKTLWPQERLESETYDDNPLLALIPKSEEFYGENMYIALRYTDVVGRSATFSVAQANKNPHKGVRFLLTRGRDFAIFGIEHELILAAKKDKGALVRSLNTESSSAHNVLTNSLALAMFGDGAGVRGQLLADPATASSFTLKKIEEVVNFEVDQKIVFAATRLGALRAGGTRTISAVDRDTGVITVSAALDAALDANDFIFCEGDAAAGGSTKLPVGLLGWVPASAPDSTAFFGVDRSPDPVRLGGLRVDVSTLNPEEGLATMLSRADREGARLSHIMRNPVDYKNIQVALGSKIETEYTSVGTIGFTAIKVLGPKGAVKIYSDKSCPPAVGFSLTMKSLKFHSLGKAPMTIEADGNSILRDATADSFEGRMALYGNMACDAPGHNVYEVLPS